MKAVNGSLRIALLIAAIVALPAGHEPSDLVIAIIKGGAKLLLDAGVALPYSNLGRYDRPLPDSAELRRRRKTSQLALAFVGGDTQCYSL